MNVFIDNYGYAGSFDALVSLMVTAISEPEVSQGGTLIDITVNGFDENSEFTVEIIDDDDELYGYCVVESFT